MSAKANKKSSPQPQIRNAADFRTIYVNFAQTAANVMDISLGVGEAGPTQAGVAEVEMKARLVMAPLQAKIMLGMLFQVIQQYETQFGKIMIPDAVASQFVAPVPDSDNKGSTEGD
jgi:uncharacterized protein DUF3467